MADPVRLFISHSSKDRAFAERLVRLIRSALNLPVAAIRATSIDGYRLPGGANVDDQLRREVIEAEAFVGILSLDSLESLYALFELGARWGARKPFIPLLAPGTSPQDVGRPLSALNALRADSTGQMHQLISELSDQLGVGAQPVAAFEADLRALAGSSSGASGGTGDDPDKPELEPSREAGAVLLQLQKEDGLAASQLAYRLRVSLAKAEQLAELLRERRLLKTAGEPGAPANYFITKLGRKYLVVHGPAE